MGIFGSKKFRKIPEMSPNIQSLIPPNMQKLEDNTLTKMRRQLYNDAPTFILNNLLLSIQFFNNYEKDIADLRMSNISSRENEINIQLSKEQKHCIIPDTLHELIDTNVCFQPKHGAAKYYSETLHSQRILVAYDNIEVRNPSETAEYSSALDGPIYKCVIEGTELKGYVQLKLKEIEVKRKMSNRNNPEQIIEKKEIIKINENAKERTEYEENNSDKTDGNEDKTDDNDNVFLDSPISLLNEQQTLVRQLSLSTQEMIKLKQKQLNKLNETEYTYSTITNHYTPKPLKQIQSNNKDKILAPITNSTQLPSSCITSVQVKVYRDKIEEEVEKRKLREQYPNINDFRQQMILRKKRELYKKIVYLNSIAFCEYFGDTFPQYISEKLGFNQNHIEKVAMMQSAIIYIDVFDKQTKHVTNYEVIPSVTSSWPDEAYEWRLRTRPVIQDAKTKTAYCWPTPGMISRVKSFPSYIYPIGFHPKRGENINRDLQWRLQFPIAERFLESHLHHAQIRCYLITIVFFKSFIESKDNKLGLTADHIRTHLFWECERDYVRWPENRLGEKLIVFLKNLCDHLSHYDLRDYFIPTRNLFENIPEKHLRIAHRKIVDILENPVMYTLRALRNLKYRKDSFYPLLNYNKLYSILMSDNIFELINPQISVMKTNAMFNENGEVKSKEGDESSGDELDPEQRWYRDAYRKRQQEKEIEKKKKERKRRISCDSINTEIQPVRVMDIMRQLLVLKLFISHFIEMARKSNDFNNPQQGLMYLQQAKNLNILLSEMASGQEDGIEYSAHISQVEQSLKITLAQEENLPKIPARKEKSHSRITKPTVLINEPKASTTSSDYVNVEPIIEKSTEKEHEQKCSDQINNMEISQDTFEQQNFQNVTSVQTQEFNTKNIKEIIFEKSIETGENYEIDIKQNRKISSDEVSSENLLTVQVDIHSPSNQQIALNENNSGSLKCNVNKNSNKNENNDSKLYTVNQSKNIQGEIILNDDYSTRLNSKSNKNLNEANHDNTTIENHSNKKNLETSNMNPNKNKNSKSFSKINMMHEVENIQKGIILNNDHLTCLKSENSKYIREVNKDNSQQNGLRVGDNVNDFYLNRQNPGSYKNLNDISYHTVNNLGQNNQKYADIFESNKIHHNKNNTSFSSYNSNPKVITLQNEYSSRLNYGNNRCLNESSPDDNVIIENKLEPTIILRTNSVTTRSNINSIILCENPEEFECTEL